jgi:hypothetical protein
MIGVVDLGERFRALQNNLAAQPLADLDDARKNVEIPESFFEGGE